ncbi:MAG: hypothetical protein ACR2NA_07390 [Solirubrobacterales bacterium]
MGEDKDSKLPGWVPDWARPETDRSGKDADATKASNDAPDESDGYSLDDSESVMGGADATTASNESADDTSSDEAAEQTEEEPEKITVSHEEVDDWSKGPGGFTLGRTPYLERQKESRESLESVMGDEAGAASLAPGTAQKILERDNPEPGEVKEVDATGADKRRKIVGEGYGPQRKTQLMAFGGALAALIIVFGGAFLAVTLFDKVPTENPVVAPWEDTSLPPRDFN